jgi:hypothetical protein
MAVFNVYFKNKYKIIPIILTLGPFLLGWFNTLLIRVLPNTVTFMQYVFVLLLLLYMVFLGRTFAKSGWKPISALTAGNGIAVLCIILYYIFETTNTKINYLLFSYSSCFYTISVNLLRAFNINNNLINNMDNKTVVLTSTLLIILSFTFGYLVYYSRSRKSNNKGTA